jgi:hypothetical protein
MIVLPMPRCNYRMLELWPGASFLQLNLEDPWQMPAWVFFFHMLFATDWSEIIFTRTSKPFLLMLLWRLVLTVMSVDNCQTVCLVQGCMTYFHLTLPNRTPRNRCCLSQVHLCSVDKLCF